jgi:2-C-methyl-D-erythritol 2,4-cyclodiphosphate synthase
MQVGIGYDVHKLAKGRKLILGGVEIPFIKGLEGWSDADVLLHSLGDALLGALGEGDLGKHFPNNDLQYKGISSLILLGKIYSLLEKKEVKVNNVDATIVAQEPALSPYIERMRENIARVLKIEKNRVNIKATTTEGLGFSGKGEGIAAYAVASIEDEF